MIERLTKRKGNFVFINTDTIPRSNCKGEYGFKMCQHSKHCPSIANRKCPVLKVLDRLAEYEDKATPIKPDYWGDGYDDDGNLIYDNAKCPTCGHDFEFEINEWGSNFCQDCGQALDWSVENEN